MCNFELSIASIETAYPITFVDYFVTELTVLQAFVEAGLLTIDEEWLSVAPKGRLLIRNICMVFDRYLAIGHATKTEPLRYSKTI
jgi:oxygen-independent coproporphyrinogen-3 oxidase